MALIKCPECQSEISKAATSCPRCGKPFKKKSSGLGCLIALILSALVVWGIYESNTTTTPGANVSAQMEKLREPGQSLTDTACKMKQMSETFNTSMNSIVALDALCHEHNMTLSDLEKCLNNLRDAQKRAANSDPQILSVLKVLHINAEEFSKMDIARAFEKIAQQYVKSGGNAEAESVVYSLIPFSK